MGYRRRNVLVRIALSPWLWAALLVVAIVATCIIWVLGNRAAKRECVEDGGRVVEVHGVRDTGWFCSYPGERP